ncbi:PKD domain-containing protein [Cryobacterium sandaracinum]|uniref:PKD domain-containing protein n=1 Tax=Cryobacterium sandaracinum TaxID=1259247 RepID=A0ABY2JA47_9MICO|nr:PKD domain-containing protein [Cryobacterium sandaracinum]
MRRSWGTITNHLWDFGDGTSAVGAIVEHTYAQPGQYLVALVTTDDDGAEGFGSAASVIDTTRSLPAVSVKSPLTTPSVGGNVVVTGKVSYQSTARILGNLTSGGPLTVIDGKSTTQLASLGSIGGQITSNTTVPPVVVDGHAFVYKPTEWIDPVNTTWRQWMNATATSNNAPTWSRGLSANPGCTLSPGCDSVNGKIVTLSTPTLVDARRSVNGCSAVTVQNMEIAMSSDLTLIADKIGIVNGLKVTSADGKAHVLRLIATGNATSCTSTNGISASGGLNIDPKISTQVLAAGQAKIDGPASFSGQVLAACFPSSGATNIAYANVVTPGLVVPQ